jgi:hypothetical protein
VVRDSRLATNFRPDAPSPTGRNPPPLPDPFVKTAGGEQLASPAPDPGLRSKIAKSVPRFRVDRESVHQSRDLERELGRITYSIAGFAERARSTAASTCSRVVGNTGTGLSWAPTRSSISVQP